jgi:hypothetical protein
MEQTKATGGKRNLVRGALLGWLGLATVLLLIAPGEFVTDAAYFALLPMAGWMLILAGRGAKERKRPFRRENRCQWITAAALTGVFFLLLSLPGLLEGPLFSEEGLCGVWWPFRWLRLLYLAWNYVGFLPAYFLSVFFCLFWVMEQVPLLKAEPLMGSAPMQKKGTMLAFILPLAIACGLSLSATSPSLIVGDASTVLAWARDGVWSEWHTAGYLLFVRVIWLLTGTSRGVTVIQALAYGAVHALALDVFREQGMDLKAGKVYIWAAIIGFVPIYFLQAALKDVVFAVSLMGFSVSVLRVLYREKPGAGTWALVGLWGLCTCLFRHAGWLPVGATLLLVLIKRLGGGIRRGLPPLLTGAVVGGCYVLLVNVLVLGVFKAERNPEIIPYSAPMTMIGAVAASGVEIPPEDKAVMEQVMPVEKWAACYDPYFADSLSRQYGKIGDDADKVNTLHLGPALIKVNWHFLTRYPVVYLKAFFNLNSLIWEITTPGDGYVRSYLTYPMTAIYDLVEEAGRGEEGVDRITKELKLPEGTSFSASAPFVNRYAEFLYGTPVLRSILWRGGFALFALIAAGVVLVQKRKSRALIAMVPIFTVVAAMLFSMPAQEVRYVFPSLECGLFFGVYAWFVPAQTREEGQGGVSCKN